MTQAPYFHVRKEDLRQGSSLLHDPPWPSFDVVARRDYDTITERYLIVSRERNALRRFLTDTRHRYASRMPDDWLELAADLLDD